MAPRLENSTRTTAFSTTVVLSCESEMTFRFAGVTAVIVAADRTAEFCLAACCEDPLPLPATAGPLCTVLVSCGTFAGGFGPKYLAHKMMTTIESSDAANILSSGVNLSFCGPSGGN